MSRITVTALTVSFSEYPNYTLARRPDSPDKIEIGKARQLSFGEIAGYQAGKEVVLFFGGF